MPEDTNTTTPPQQLPQDGPATADDVVDLPEYAVGTDPIYIDNEEDRELIDAMVNDALEYGDTDGLRDIFAQLDRLIREAGRSFQEQHPDLYDHHRRNMAKCAVPIMERLVPNDVEFVLRDHTDLLQTVDLEEVLRDMRSGLLVEPDLEQRDKVKQEYRRAVRSSQVLVGSKQITVGSQQLDPTIENWFVDWRDFLGDRDPEALLVVEYLNSRANVRDLNEDERELLEKVLRIHTALKHSSFTPEGSEQQVMFMDPESGTFKIFQAGEIRDTGVPVPEDDLEQLRLTLGYNENGTKMSAVELVKKSPAFRRYATPNIAGEPQTEGEVTEQEAAAAEALIVETDNTEIQEIEEMAKVAAEAGGDTAPTVEPLPEPTPEPVAPQEPASTLPEPPSTPARPAAPEIAAPQDDATPFVPTTAEENLPEPVESPVAPETPAPAPAPQPTLTAPAPPAPAPKKKRRRKKKKKHEVPVDYGQVAGMVLDAHKFLFPSADVEKRFLSVLSSYTSGDRERDEAFKDLIEATEQGGIGFTQAEAEAALQTGEEIRDRAERDPVKFAEEAARRNTSTMTPTFEMAQNRIQEEQRKEDAVRPEVARRRGNEVEDIFANVPEDELRPLPDPNAEEERVAVTMPAETAGAAGSRLVGPIDELQGMTLEEFRSYSTDPTKASTEVLQRIHTMEQESIGKKAEAIQAWKASPLNQLYLKIGNYSLESTLPVESAIRDMEKKGEPVLTLQEFDAIADINRQVRF